MSGGREKREGGRGAREKVEKVQRPAHDGGAREKVEKRHGMIASAPPGPEIRVQGDQFDRIILVKSPSSTRFTHSASPCVIPLTDPVSPPVSQSVSPWQARQQARQPCPCHSGVSLVDSEDVFQDSWL